MREIEIEILVEDFSEVKENLLKGKKPSKILKFRDVYFDLERAKKGERIRLRKVVDEKGKEKAILTYKKPEIKGGVQKAEEYEVKISSFEDMYNLLEAIFGKPYFDERLHVEKYELGKVKFELREVIGLFKYIEIEGEEEEIKKIASKIGGKILKEGAFNYVCKLKEIDFS